jgi:hypothetical protein
LLSLSFRGLALRLLQLCFAIIFLSCPCPAAGAVLPALKINVIAPPQLLNRSATRLTVEDGVALLRRAFPRAVVSCNGGAADVVIRLPDLPPDSHVSTGISSSAPDDGSYCWRSSRQGKTIVLRLSASTPEAAACGLYGLLQEKLAIRFVHPRETIIPRYRSWPLAPGFRFSGTPRFASRGFHLHTLHPIELTEPLMNPDTPGSLEAVKEYIDWLTRNGQNSMQFFLLRGIDREKWIRHAAAILEYAHRRGVRCGVEISLAMLQQQAFQSLALLRFYPSYDRQVDETLAWLFRARWDFITLEATMGEHLPFLGMLMPGVQRHLEREVALRYRSKLMYATHVITNDEGEKVRRPLEPTSGILIHTVMCYSASEPRAPVYGNANQCFMLEAARDEFRRRETWYWPESSYWVGFDSSVPMLLLPYLDSRWNDMERMARLGIAGHLTFTSGWEWGYWLVDWSIARWSWRFSDGGRVRTTAPLSCFDDLSGDPQLSRLWSEALRLQNRYLKEKELLRYLAALTPFSELPHPLDKPFQPEPGFRYSWLFNDAPQEKAEAVLKGPVADMEAYAAAMTALAARIDERLARLESSGEEGPRLAIGLSRELNYGLKVTALRAGHRALTLRALLEKRREKGSHPVSNRQSERLLIKAATVRAQAQALIMTQEKGYRYPLEQIARRGQNLTAYPFGYLYPASRLFFWEREEEQVRQERFDALFMNLWDFRRTLGVGSLFFRN